MHRSARPDATIESGRSLTRTATHHGQTKARTAVPRLDAPAPRPDGDSASVRSRSREVLKRDIRDLTHPVALGLTPSASGQCTRMSAPQRAPPELTGRVRSPEDRVRLVKKQPFHFPKSIESQTLLHHSNFISFANVPTPTSVHHLVHVC
jgi:hypothetical protein